MIALLNVKQTGAFHVLDLELLEKVLMEPGNYCRVTFLCPGQFFNQRPPYSNTYSNTLVRLMNRWRHFDWRFVLINSEDLQVKDKAVLRHLTGSMRCIYTPSVVLSGRT
jgi:hypothetical protein